MGTGSWRPWNTSTKLIKICPGHESHIIRFFGKGTATFIIDVERLPSEEIMGTVLGIGDSKNCKRLTKHYLEILSTLDIMEYKNKSS